LPSRDCGQAQVPVQPEALSVCYAHELVFVYHFHSAHLSDDLILSRNAEAVGTEVLEPSLAPSSQSNPPSIGRIAIDMRRGTVCLSNPPGRVIIGI